MTNPWFFLGMPRPFKNICQIYPPNIKEVLETDLFGLYSKLLTTSNYDLMEPYIEKDQPIPNDLLTPFEYLMNLTYNSAEVMILARQAIHFFTHENCYILPEQKQIIFLNMDEEASEIKSIEDLRILKEEDYFDFQNAIRDAIGDPSEQAPNPKENPRITLMKAKARWRDNIKKRKSGGLNLGSLLASICCMNLGINPLNIGELSYAAIATLVQFYQNKEEYELNVQSLLAGADSKKIELKHWMRNIED